MTNVEKEAAELQGRIFEVFATIPMGQDRDSIYLSFKIMDADLVSALALADEVLTRLLADGVNADFYSIEEINLEDEA